MIFVKSQIAISQKEFTYRCIHKGCREEVLWHFITGRSWDGNRSVILVHVNGCRRQTCYVNCIYRGEEFYSAIDFVREYKSVEDGIGIWK